MPHAPSARTTPTTRQRLASPALIAIAALMLCLTGCGSPEPQAPPAPAVAVDSPKSLAVTEYYQYTGTLAATEMVELRARVPGFIDDIDFKPSTDVTKDDLLFLIEPGPYAAATAAATAEVRGARDSLKEAEVTLERTRESFRGGAVTQQELTLAETQVAIRQATVDLAKANLDTAKIQEGYTRVLAPISGRIDRNRVDIGDLVGSGEPTLLATIANIDPIWAYFDVSERIVLEYLERGRNGELPQDAEDRNRDLVELALANTPAGQYPFKGKIDFVDNAVDEATGTIRVRAIFPNQNKLLFPGLFVRARVPYAHNPQALVIEENAIGTDLVGKFVWVLDANNTASKRYLPRLGGQRGAFRVVLECLSTEDRYVVSGIQNVQPNQPVTVIERPPGSAPKLPPGDAPPPTATQPTDAPADPTTSPPTTPPAAGAPTE
ncbi:MAG: efflux RND transporter periplasmic adaptor subunit [Planctomycetota bacterium]